MTHTLSIQVNGEPLALPSSDTTHAPLEVLLTHLEMTTTARGVAIAINDEVVPRSTWTQHTLHAHDRVEIIRATQGG